VDGTRYSVIGINLVKDNPLNGVTHLYLGFPRSNLGKLYFT
jgi:hypothetical protein